MHIRVPFLDLNSHHAALRSELDRAIREVIDSGAFAGGPFVEKFEADFASYCGCRYAIGVGSGTEALGLSLLACGVGAGDEVITVSNTFMATAEAITYSGARPVFVDVNETTYTMDPAGLEEALSPRTKTIIPVHLFGQPADMDPILEFARNHNLSVIEDAAQAHGSKYKGRTAGTLGDAGCFSFYPSKNLGAYGEAGAIVTNDEELSQKLRLLRDHGSTSKYVHAIVGYNFRMEEIQAAVLNVKLPHLDDWNDQRRNRALIYNDLLKDCGVGLPRAMDYARHIYHVYAIQSDNRDALQKHLTANGIQTGVHYPIPIHLQPAYASLGYRQGDLAVTERLSERVLSLPMFPELGEDQQRQVANVLRRITAG